MKKFMKVSLIIACKKGDEKIIEHELMNSDLAQQGLYSFGTQIIPCNKQETNEILSQVPEELL